MISTKWIVKYSRMLNEENDGRRKPKWQSYTQWGCLYDTLEEAQNFANMCQYDCYQVDILQADLSVVQQWETQE